MIDIFYKDEARYARILLKKLEEVASGPDGELKSHAREILETNIECKTLIGDFLIYEDCLTSMGPINEGNLEGWTTFLNNEETKFFYKKEEGRPLYTFFCEKKINAPIFNVLSILAEAQLYSEWIPLMYKSELNNRVCNTRFSGEFGITAPWPFYNRDVFIQISAIPVEA